MDGPLWVSQKQAEDLLRDAAARGAVGFRSREPFAGQPLHLALWVLGLFPVAHLCGGLAVQPR